jgi:phenylacetate-coenzyme A ligase PaaK-like adenylate-forming protein
VYSHFINKAFVWNRQRLFISQKDALAHQKALLDRIITINCQVDYLKKLAIHDTKSFIQNCPVIEYDSLESLILQIRDQNINHLCVDDVVAFAKSSGTTSRSKFIPLTKAGIQSNFTAGKTMLSHYLTANPNSRIFEGKNFSLTGTYAKSGKYIIGDVSALFTYFLSPWYKPFRLPNMQLATIADWNEKLDKLVPILANADVRWIAGVPSWMNVVIERVEDYAQMPIQRVWSNLEVYFYGGVNVKPFESYYSKKFDGRLKLWQTYNASEGFFGLQEEENSEDFGLLFNVNNYYEFIHYNEINSQNPLIIRLEELKEGEIYELVITNSSGLYRYRMGDLLRITKVNPWRFEIVGRTRNSINVFGEELMVSNTERAIAELNKQIDFLIKDYTVAPVLNGNTGHHHWLIEFIKVPRDLINFQERLDDILRSINSDYDAKRFNNLILKPLTVEVLKNNSMEKWLEFHKRKTVQAKIPKLWKDDSIQKQLTAIEH